MKKVIQLAVIVISGLFSSLAPAQSKTPILEDSLLWEVSGNGLDQPSYVFGTMHMMCENDFIIKEKVKRAFEKTTQLALEIDMDDPLEIEYLQKMATEGDPLSEVLAPKEYKELDAFLKSKVGVGAAYFEKSNLTTIMSVVMFKSLNCTPKMFEMEFMQMAAERKMELVGLEKAAVQITAFKNSYTNTEFIKQLTYYDTRFFEVATKAYNGEDLDELYTIMIAEKFMDSNAKAWILDKRNKSWVTKMPDLMRNQPVFFAVGAAHLPGNTGIITLLRNAGYTVTPILK